MNREMLEKKDYRLWAMLRQVADITRKVREKELAQYNLSPMNASILFTLKFSNKSLTLTEIAQLLIREPHTISANIARMKKAGLIRKERNSVNASRVDVTITEKGEQAHADSLNIDGILGSFSNLSEKQKDQLFDILSIIRESAFQQIHSSPVFPFK